MNHARRVNAVAFSPDGKMIVTGSDDTAQLWNASDTKPIGQPMNHARRVNAVAFSPDGKLIVTGSDDCKARLWSADDGTPIGPTLNHLYPVEAVAFGPDSTTLLTGHRASARRWRVPSPVGGDSRRITLWVQVITGLDLDESGAVHILDAKTWQVRRRLLEELGGPPNQANRIPEPW
jgi:WD40 repeat protein